MTEQYTPQNREQFIYPGSDFAQGYHRPGSALYADLIQLESNARLLRGFLLPAKPGSEQEYSLLVAGDPLNTRIFSAGIIASMGYDIRIRDTPVSDPRGMVSKGCTATVTAADYAPVYAILDHCLQTDVSKTFDILDQWNLLRIIPGAKMLNPKNMEALDPTFNKSFHDRFTQTAQLRAMWRETMGRNAVAFAEHYMGDLPLSNKEIATELHKNVRASVASLGSTLPKPAGKVALSAFANFMKGLTATHGELQTP